MSTRLLTRVCLLVCLCWFWVAGAAADAGTTSKINITGISNERMVENLRSLIRTSVIPKISSLPASEKDNDYEPYYELVAAQLSEAVEPFGYYHAQFKIDVETLPSHFAVDVDLGAPIQVRQVKLESVTNLDGAARSLFVDWRNRFPLVEGDVLDQTGYESYKRTLLVRATERGFLQAKYVQSKIAIDKQLKQADIVLVFDFGQLYRIGNINWFWLFDEQTDVRARQGLDDKLIRQYLTIQAGDVFKTEDITRTQQRFNSAPYFSNVRIRTDQPDPATATVDVNLELSPAKRKIYSAEIGAGTDTGGRGGLGFENKRINRAGHRVSARVGGSEIQRNINANYIIPTPHYRKGVLDFYASLSERFSDNRDFSKTQLGASFNHQWRALTLSYGLQASEERFLPLTDDSANQESGSRVQTRLIMPSIELFAGQSDDPSFPSRGWSLLMKAQGSSSTLGSDIDLFQLYTQARLLQPLGKGTLRMRLTAARSLLDDRDVLPASLGYLAGGDDSVRGYDFESIGIDVNDEVEVAENLLTGSIEYQYPVWRELAVATFIDAGDAFNSKLKLNLGTGVGLRWRLPFGEMRLDAATALDRDGNPWRLHFNFGTSL